MLRTARALPFSCPARPSRTASIPKSSYRYHISSHRNVATFAKNRLKLYEIDINVAIDLAVTDDHEQIQKYFQDYSDSEATQEDKQAAVWLAIKALSAHLVKKDMVFFPAVRHHVGDQTADKLLKPSNALKARLLELDSMAVDAEGFSSKFEALVKDLQKQFQLEANEVLPSLKRAPGMDLQKLEQLGIDFAWASYCAPSRPHPELPSSPPFDEELFKAVKHADMKRDLQRYNVLQY